MFLNYIIFMLFVYSLINDVIFYAKKFFIKCQFTQNIQIT